MRVPPLPADQWDDAVDHALSSLPPERRNPDASGNLLATLVRHHGCERHPEPRKKPRQAGLE